MALIAFISNLELEISYLSKSNPNLKLGNKSIFEMYIFAWQKDGIKT